SLQGVGAASGVALGDWWPLQGSRPRRIETSGASPVVSQAALFAVTDEYFATLGISIRDGRVFAPEDRHGSEPVAIVSESVAWQLWPSDRAVGQRVTLQPGEDRPPIAPPIIGVVPHGRQ